MKAMKFLSLAALALTFAACSSDDDALTAQQPAEQPGEVTITATIDINDGAKTRALTTDGSKVTSAWVVGEKIAVLFVYNSAQTVREAEVKSLSGTTANIEFTIPADLTGSQEATLVYPATAVNTTKTGADIATALATQDGTIANCPEVRTGTGTLDASAKTLTVSSALTAQTAIFKFTLQNLSAAAKDATDFTVSDGSGNVITTVTPGTATGTLYVALPTLAAATYWFNATIDSKPYIAKATTATDLSASYYTQTVKMATVGDVILSDGKFAAKGTDADGERAIITYVGSDNGEDSPYNHGLAFAMSDAGNGGNICWSLSTTTDNTEHPNQSSSFTIESGLQYNDAKHDSNDFPAFKAAMANNGTAAPTGCSAWFLASGYQWTKMIAGAGSASNLRSLAGLQANNYYWTSSETSAQSARDAWQYDFKKWRWLQCVKSDSQNKVRACLAF